MKLLLEKKINNYFNFKIKLYISKDIMINKISWLIKSMNIKIKQKKETNY